MSQQAKNRLNLSVSKEFLCWFSLAIAILVINIFIAKSALERQSDATNAVENSLRVIDALKEVQFNTANLEVSQRNYIVSGKVAHLDSATEALRAASEGVRKAASFSPGNGDKVSQNSEALNALVTERLHKLEALRRLHMSKGFSAAIKAIKEDNGGATMDRAHQIINRMSEDEDALLSESTAQSRQDTHLSLITFYVGALFNLILLCFIYSITSREIKERRQAENKLRFTATHDPLTTLPNRTLFSERLNLRLSNRRRQDGRLAVLFIDLDRFKNINDTLGHEAGDRLLQDVAFRLSACVRQDDIIARQGGDEFVVLIEQFTDPSEVAGAAEKILTEVAKPLFVEGKEFHVTASIGISTYPDDGTDMHSLMKNADIAMYRAKEKGKNNYQFYAEQMNEHSIERLALEADLRRALERDELRLHYQPKVDARTGKISGMEALIRWQHPALGMVPPGQWISVAEETGLIVPIGEWVLRTACAQNRAWQKQGLPKVRVAVNLSPRQFGDAALATSIRQILNETHLDPRWLELEITENLVMHDPEQAVRTMEEMKGMGIALAIDDFGIGYSSLASLMQFPVDSLKVDGSFVRGIPHNADHKAITAAIIALGHSLKLKVVVEGVETDEQAKFLRDQNCDEMQGYYFSKGVNELEFTALLEEQQEKSRPKSLTSRKKNLSAA